MKKAILKFNYSYVKDCITEVTTSKIFLPFSLFYFVFFDVALFLEFFYFVILLFYFILCLFLLFAFNLSAHNELNYPAIPSPQKIKDSI
jgi:hypothetical protein